ncbi:50S ribosomal protein L23 [Thiorhodospira sibirica]|uniref:50S ribosomal protein L23 n=1 Tax=Thiorhodospira sibirica TaxID=154347 RepID=UPI00022C3A29|nr:50S ribosomal protein L23 [Thiorhodospira sibirica]
MNEERLLKVLVGPHISEKATMLGEKTSQLVLKVAPDASCTEIKRAVELIFKVGVNSVRTVNVKGKRKRFGQIQGRRKDWKKAYITLVPGEAVELTDVDVAQTTS